MDKWSVHRIELCCLVFERFRNILKYVLLWRKIFSINTWPKKFGKMLLITRKCMNENEHEKIKSQRLMIIRYFLLWDIQFYYYSYLKHIHQIICRPFYCWTSKCSFVVENQTGKKVHQVEGFGVIKGWV